VERELTKNRREAKRHSVYQTPAKICRHNKGDHRNLNTQRRSSRKGQEILRDGGRLVRGTQIPPKPCTGSAPISAQSARMASRPSTQLLQVGMVQPSWPSGACSRSTSDEPGDLQGGCSRSSWMPKSSSRRSARPSWRRQSFCASWKRRRRQRGRRRARRARPKRRRRRTCRLLPWRLATRVLVVALACLLACFSSRCLEYAVSSAPIFRSAVIE